ncbi:MAG: glycerate kinase [Syntrophorhabdales bacterium]|jgi:glycerate-2-kinase
MDEKGRVIDIYDAAIAAVDPYRAVMGQREVILDAYREGPSTTLCVIGFGKAAQGMVRAVLDIVGDKVSRGVAITKYGHWADRGEDRIRVYEAGHPIPDENGVKATRQAIALARSLDEKSLLVCLISGGGSALLVAPAPGILLAEKQRTIDLLLRAGADIHELNVVRKHISAVKGGRLAQIAYPARVVSLILSDVIDDRLDIIASGPTVPDETTYADALGVIEKYRLRDEVPRKVYDHLVEGKEGSIPEAPGKDDPLFDRVTNTIVGSNRQAIEAAGTRCGHLGIDAVKIDRPIRGEARDAGRWLVSEARRMLKGRKGTGKGLCLISGGETTVTVRGRGRGGRNMELALAAAIEMEGIEGMTLLSAGTDGTDGPTDAAGAIVDGRSIGRGREAGLDPGTCLSNNDSYRFLRGSGDLLVTGPTGTNVMDIQVMLLSA